MRLVTLKARDVVTGDRLVCKAGTPEHVYRADIVGVDIADSVYTTGNARVFTCTSEVSTGRFAIVAYSDEAVTIELPGHTQGSKS